MQLSSPIHTALTDCALIQVRSQKWNGDYNDDKKVTLYYLFRMLVFTQPFEYVRLYRVYFMREIRPTCTHQEAKCTELCGGESLSASTSKASKG